MRNHLRPLIAAVLVLALLLLSGCSGAAPIDTSLPATASTTVPATTAPRATVPETTIPETESEPTVPETVSINLDETVPMPDSGYHVKQVEEKFDVVTYNAPGFFFLKNPTLDLGFEDGSPVTLHLPESWEGKYSVFEIIYDPHYGSDDRIWYICVVSKNVLQAYWQVEYYPFFDYALVLHRMPIETYELTLETLAEDGRSLRGAVVAQDDTYVYLVDTYETNSEIYGPAREMLISKIGEEAYLEAQGDITCTLEEAVAMCSVD